MLALALGLASALQRPPASQPQSVGQRQLASQSLRAASPYAIADAQSDPFLAPASPWSSDQGPQIPSNPAQEAKMPRVSARKLHALMTHDKGMIVVDARDTYSYEDSHIPGAINVPLMSIESLYRELPKDRLIALYCT